MNTVRIQNSGYPQKEKITKRWTGRQAYSIDIIRAWVFSRVFFDGLKYRDKTRDLWMIYRGLGFLMVVWIGYFLPSASFLYTISRSSCVSPVELTDGTEGGGRGAESYHRKESVALYKALNTLWPKPTNTAVTGMYKIYLSVKNKSW